MIKVKYGDVVVHCDQDYKITPSEYQIRFDIELSMMHGIAGNIQIAREKCFANALNVLCHHMDYAYVEILETNFSGSAKDAGTVPYKFNKDVIY